jgi:hypothetical protein
VTSLLETSTITARPLSRRRPRASPCSPRILCFCPSPLPYDRLPTSVPSHVGPLLTLYGQICDQTHTRIYSLVCASPLSPRKHRCSITSARHHHVCRAPHMETLQLRPRGVVRKTASSTSLASKDETTDSARFSRKFGKHIQKRQLEIPEYAASFVDYKALKKVIWILLPGLAMCTDVSAAHQEAQ